MVERIIKTGFTTKLILIAVAMMFSFTPDSFGRDALKLYSIGNNQAWSSSTAWSLSVNGTSAGIVPQSNDYVVIDRAVIQNVNFTFSGTGVLEITNTGILRADNVNLVFSDNSALKCNGEIKINNLNINESASLAIDANGKILVKNSLINNSVIQQAVSGKLSVTGSLSAGTSSYMDGEGAIEAAHYEGAGSVNGIKPASSIPDGSLTSKYNWLGTLNNKWGEPMNWAGGQLPGNTSNVAVLSSNHNPEITDKAISNNLYINSGSSLTVIPDAVIEINGDLSVIGAGRFLLKNTVAKKSSLFLNGTATGNIQAEYQVLKGQKNLVSSPVEMAYSKTFLNMYLRTYDESSSRWGDYIVPTNDPLLVMQGYELYSLSSETRTFEGTPDQEPKSYDISNSGNGLNLTGNPFPCYIDWENNDNNAWQRNSIASAIYYPDPSGSGNFSVYLPGGDDAVSLNNGSRFIAPMQGFFVKASNQGSLIVNKNSRVSSYTESKHELKNTSIKFKLNSCDGSTDEVMLRVKDNATFGFDDKLDAIKLQNNTDAPSMFIGSEGDVKYAVNSIPSISSSVDIPLNIESKKSGQFSLTAGGSFNFEYRYPVILEDKELKTFIDLRSDSVYTFYHAAEMNSSRFEIHFYSPESVNEKVEGFTGITVNPGEVTVSGNNNGVFTAKLFSADGKLISTSKGSLTAGINLSTGNNAAGICVLQLSDGKNTMIKKIYTK